MVSIKKKPTHVARLPRHGHDLSRRVLFTSSCGQLLPVLYDYLDAGDKITVTDDVFTRTQPLKTPAFVRCTEHVYYFFVPISQIDSYFGQAFYGIDDFVNTNDISFQFNSGSNPIPKRLPNPSLRASFSYGDMFDEFFNNTSYPIKGQALDVEGVDGKYDIVAFSEQTLFDRFGIPVFMNAIRLLDMLNYGSNWVTSCASGTSGADGFTVGDLHVNPNLLAVYQKICFDYFRNSDWDSNKPMLYNLNYYIKLGSMAEGIHLFHAKDSDSYSDDREYGSFFTIHYHPLKKDFFTNIYPSPLFDNYTGKGINSYNNTGQIPTDSMSSYLLSTWGVQLQETENSLTNKSDQGVYNAISDNTVVDGVAMRQVRSGSDDDPYYSYTIQQMRLAYAYDRLLSITQRAGKHYDDQVRAHLGISIPQGVSNEVYYLGCHSSVLQIGEVVSTAAGSNGSDSTSVLGELAGRGLGVSRDKQKPIKFTAPDKGYLMAIYSCIPDVDYKDYGVDRINLYSSINDYPQPEFDRLGMQPLYNLQADMSTFGSSVGSASGVNKFLGWQYRWAELKMSFDVVHGAFNHTLSDWTSSIFMGQFGSVADCMYCPPTYLDGVFALNFEPPFDEQVYGYVYSRVRKSSKLKDGAVFTWSRDFSPSDGITLNDGYFNTSLVYARDPLLHSIDFNYKKSTWMTTYGLPNV